MERQSSLKMTSKKISRILMALGLLWGCPGIKATVRTPQAQGDEAEFFNTRILPIFAARCQSCHNHTLKFSGLSLESAATLKAGGLQGPVVMAGNIQQSRLYRRVARMEKPFMPMNGDALPE